MMAVHFTTTSCEPNTANRLMESHIFCGIRPCANNIVCAKFEVFRSFLCVFFMGKCRSRHISRYDGLIGALLGRRDDFVLVHSKSPIHL